MVNPVNSGRSYRISLARPRSRPSPNKRPLALPKPKAPYPKLIRQTTKPPLLETRDGGGSQHPHRHYPHTQERGWRVQGGGYGVSCAGCAGYGRTYTVCLLCGFKSIASRPSLSTMYIYRGKLDFSPSHQQTATYEGITTIFPSEFRLGDPVYTFWQWSTLGKITNMPCWLTGTIDSVDNSDTDGNKIGFYGGNYRCDTTMPQNFILS